MSSKRVEIKIEDLILDPNNYRFIDRPEYKKIPDESVADERIQQRTLNFITGRKQENISDLITSFKENGFLDIEQIQVKEVGGKYLVLEGNRRTATLKYLWEEYNGGMDIGEVDPQAFNKIPVVVIAGEDPVQHLVTMGLHHISGKKRWSAVNESQLISDLIETHHLSEDDVCRKLGITKHALRKSRRTLYLINQYRDSDFGDQFQTNMFYIFQSIVGSPKLKDWLEWDDHSYIARNQNNANRLFGWLSIVENDDILDESDEERKNITTREPIINQYRQIKTLSDFIEDNYALQVMEESGDITKAYTLSKAVGKTKLDSAISTITDGTQLAYNFKEHITNEQRESLKSAKDSISNLLPLIDIKIVAEERKQSLIFKELTSHFSLLNIVNYKKLDNVNIKYLNRINLFVGGNNKGKTTVLESFYLSAQANDLKACIDLVRYRGKFSGEFNSRWVDKYFTNKVDIHGVFNENKTELSINKIEAGEEIDKNGYISSLEIKSLVGESDLEGAMHLYSDKSPDYRNIKTQVLCPSAFTSPYRHNESLLHSAHNQAIENKYYDQIIDFIRSNIDITIERIDLVNDQGEYRFKITSTKNTRALDLTEYGEGLQRVFEIALLLGYCKNGILCIDELDSAIHYSLLIRFTEFVQRIANIYNVQVFASTHSKECIDAFVKNENNSNEITAYSLIEEEGNIKCKYIDGERLEHLVESINFDIR